MYHYTIKTLLATTMLCACTLAAAQSGQGMQDRGVPADLYGYSMHNGKRDVYTEGANAIGKRDVYTDGANAIGKRDVYTDGANAIGKRDIYTDGAHKALALDIAGMDLRGVSAPPA